jgi:hypothetical protein
MSGDTSRIGLWLLLAAGFAACLAYPLGVLSLNRNSVCGALGAASNAIAGALFAAMILVQLAAGDRDENSHTQAVWLGLDVAWDIYIGVGTLLFAAASYAHRWFGKTIGISGIIIALLLLVLNLWTFPTPPASAGLFDVGPLVGSWYLVVTLAASRGLWRLAA